MLPNLLEVGLYRILPRVLLDHRLANLPQNEALDDGVPRNQRSNLWNLLIERKLLILKHLIIEQQSRISLHHRFQCELL